MQTEPDTFAPRFLMTPERARVDEAVEIRLIGLLLEQMVTVRVTICDETGRE